MATEREIEEIKSRLNIYDIVSGYITLKRSGSNYFGLCPFHHEKSPSFSVSPDIGIFKCFGCQESGDVISFVQKIENLTFREAIEKLADKAGVVLSKSVNEEKSQKKRILEMNALAHQVFTYILLSHKSGEKGREYVKSRKINGQSLKDFGLGFDHGDAVVKVLLKRGFTKDEILNFGLGVNRNGKLVDKYRERLIFPIYSVSGDIVGFSGRIVEKNENSPKYINSPETDAFKKSTILYGLFQAKQSIKENDQVILLEGPMDVISAHQNGVKYACAVQGTSLTSGHLDVLKRFTDKITFCFDQDSAGLNALKRSFFIATDNHLLPKVITITDAKDVDEKVNKDLKGFKNDITSPKDIVEYLLNISIEKHNISTLEGKLKVIQEVLPVIAQINDEIKRKFYLSKLAEGVQIAEGEIKKMLESKDEKKKQEIKYTLEKRVKSENNKLSYALALFLQEYSNAKTYILNFDPELFYDLDTKALFIKLRAAAKEDTSIKSFLESLPEDEKEKCLALMSVELTPITTGGIESQIQSIETILKKRKTIRDINDLKNKLWIYEQDHNDEMVQNTMNEIAMLTREIKK